MTQQIHTIESITSQQGVYLDNITVNGKNTLIDFYLNWHDDHENTYQYQDDDENIIANLDITLPLIPKILSKGVFETVDKITNQKVSIQFYKSESLNLEEKQFVYNLNI